MSVLDPDIDKNGSESIAAVVKRLIAEAREFGEAEVALRRAQLAGRIAAGRTAAILAVVALMLLQAVLVALLVGLVLMVSVRWGPAWATLIVVAGTLALIAILAVIAVSNARVAAGRDGKKP